LAAASAPLKSSDGSRSAKPSRWASDGLGERPPLLQPSQHVRGGSVQYAAEGVDLLAGEGFSQCAHDRNGCGDRAFAVEACVARGEVFQQRGVASERLLVRGDDGGATVERTADPARRVRRAAGLDEDVDRRIGSEAGGVVRKRGGSPIAKVRTLDGDARDSQPFAGYLLQRGPALGERGREGGANGPAADETNAQLDG
jgi:hypothetical protein